jgi:hypothetical protein
VWSPRDRRFRDRTFRVLTIGADGSGLEQLARGRFCAESFSPDGTKLLLLGNCESETDSYLLTMNVDGTGLKRIPNTKGAHWASWGRQGEGAAGDLQPSHEPVTFGEHGSDLGNGVRLAQSFYFACAGDQANATSWYR